MEHRHGVVGAESRRDGRLHDQHTRSKLARHAHHRRTFGHRRSALARHESRFAEHQQRGAPIKSVVMVLAGAIVLGGLACAQTSDRGYVEGVAQSAFGNVTSQSYGVECGATIRPTLQVYGEFGQIRDVADTAFTTNASTIASALAQVQSAAVGFTAKRPVLFGGGGIKFRPVTTM